MVNPPALGKLRSSRPSMPLYGIQQSYTPSTAAATPALARSECGGPCDEFVQRSCVSSAFAPGRLFLQENRPSRSDRGWWEKDLGGVGIQRELKEVLRTLGRVWDRRGTERNGEVVWEGEILRVGTGNRMEEWRLQRRPR